MLQLQSLPLYAVTALLCCSLQLIRRASYLIKQGTRSEIYETVQGRLLQARLLQNTNLDL
jgi:hypothetical protein